MSHFLISRPLRRYITAFVAGACLQALAAAPIYPDPSSAKNDIAQALAQAAASHKRVILDFGGNWCGDCQVLDANFHKPENLALLDASFLLVHINIGINGVDRNIDLAEQYGIPLKKGVPALAVVDAGGKILYSQQHGEFEDMRHMDAKSVNEFLNHWKAE